MSGSVTIIYLIIAIIEIASLWVIFTKAGKAGWLSIIPIVNFIVLLQIVNKPIWWIILLLIPLVNLIVLIVVYFELAKSFGKSEAYGCGMLILPFIFIPLLAFSGAQYTKPL